MSIRVTNIECPGGLGSVCFDVTSCAGNFGVALKQLIDGVFTEQTIQAADPNDNYYSSGATGGTWTTPPFQPYQVYTTNRANVCISNLPAGTYKIYVVNQDSSTACYETFDFEISQVQGLEVGYEEIVDAPCDGNAVGIQIKAKGGSGNYRYLVTGNPLIPNVSLFQDNIPTIDGAGAVNAANEDGVFYFYNQPSAGTASPNDLFVGTYASSPAGPSTRTVIRPRLPLDANPVLAGGNQPYHLWVYDGICNPVFVGVINPSDYDVFFIATFDPPTLSCGKSNCDGTIYINVTDTLKRNKNYSVKIYSSTILADLNLNNWAGTGALLPIATRHINCDSTTACSKGIIIENVCHLDSTEFLSENLSIGYVIEVYDERGCNIRTEAGNTHNNTQIGERIFGNYQSYVLFGSQRFGLVLLNSASTALTGPSLQMFPRINNNAINRPVTVRINEVLPPTCPDCCDGAFSFSIHNSTGDRIDQSALSNVNPCRFIGVPNTASQYMDMVLTMVSGPVNDKFYTRQPIIAGNLGTHGIGNTILQTTSLLDSSAPGTATVFSNLIGNLCQGTYKYKLEYRPLSNLNAKLCNCSIEFEVTLDKSSQMIID